jgi:hypothetical protein
VMVLLAMILRTAVAAEAATGLGLVETAPAQWQAQQPKVPQP